jgi:hypothetical protein
MDLDGLEESVISGSSSIFTGVLGIVPHGLDEKTGWS